MKLCKDWKKGEFTEIIFSPCLVLRIASRGAEHKLKIYKLYSDELAPQAVLSNNKIANKAYNK